MSIANGRVKCRCTTQWIAWNPNYNLQTMWEQALTWGLLHWQIQRHCPSTTAELLVVKFPEREKFPLQSRWLRRGDAVAILAGEVPFLCFGVCSSWMPAALFLRLLLCVVGFPPFWCVLGFFLFFSFDWVVVDEIWRWYIYGEFMICLIFAEFIFRSCRFIHVI